MEKKEITVSETKLKKSVQSVLALMFQAPKIKTDEQYAEVTEFCKKAKVTIALVKTAYDPEIKALKGQIKEIEKQRDIFLDPLVEAEKISKSKMTQFITEKQQAQAAAMAKERVRAEAKGVAPREVNKMPAKIEGVSYRENWSAEVQDLLALVKAVADGKVPVEAIEPNDVYLNSVARTQKIAGEILPGVHGVVVKTAVVG